jgi:hypothetical protein
MFKKSKQNAELFEDLTRDEVLVVRDTFFEDCTLGKMYINGVYECETLEDKVREIIDVPVADWKIKAITAIPVGMYKLTLSMSNRFKKVLPELHSVPGYTGVRIHSGNTGQDSEGCILVGQRRVGHSVTLSRDAMAALQAKLEKLENPVIMVKGLPS